MYFKTFSLLIFCRWLTNHQIKFVYLKIAKSNGLEWILLYLYFKALHSSSTTVHFSKIIGRTWAGNNNILTSKSWAILYFSDLFEIHKWLLKILWKKKTLVLLCKLKFIIYISKLTIVTPTKYKVIKPDFWKI